MTAIRVELQLADGTFTTGMLRAGQSIADFNKHLIATHPQLQNFAKNGNAVVSSMQRMDGASKGFLSTLRDATLVFGLVSMGISKVTSAANGWAGDIVKVNSEMERLTLQMKNMSTAADPVADAAKSVAYLREQAAQAPFAMKTLTQSFTRMKASGLDPMNGSLKAIADGIAAFGGTDDQLNRVTLGITQMAGKSVIQMEEMRQQVAETMPAAMQLMARSMGLSVGELTKVIATGRLETKSALEGFTAELERAYGGTAKRTMETFSGQVSQMYTNLQTLATGSGGKMFFEAIRTQLMDLNSFLKSDMAQTFAADIGKAITGAVGYLRQGISAIWDFRNEIIRTAEVAAYGMGMVALGRGVQSFITILRTAGLEFAVFRTNISSAFSYLSLGLSGFRSGSTAILGLQYAAMGAGGAITSVIGGLSTLAPILAVIGIGAYAAAEYFGVFSDKVKESYEELKKYGAESRAAAKEINDARIAQLESELKRVRQAGRMGTIAKNEQIAVLERELAEVKGNAGRLERDAARREDEKDNEAYQKTLEDRLATAQAFYNKQQMADDNAYEAGLSSENKSNKTRAQIKEAHDKATIANQKKMSEDKLTILKDELEKAQTLEVGANEDQKRKLEARSNDLRKLIIDENKKLEAVRASSGPVLIGDSGGEESKIKKLATALDTIKGNVADVRAEFEGANGAVAKLQEQIKRGEYGSITDTTEEIVKMREELVSATAEKETFDNLMKGRKKIEQDIENAKIALLERQMALKEKMAGGDLNDFEKIKLKLDNGYYEGLGPIDNIKKAIVGVVTSLDAQGLSANSVAAVMQQNTFGDQTVNHINSVSMALREVNNQLNSVGAGLNGIDFANFGAGLGKANGLMSGFSASGSLLDLIAQGESGGDYNATLDNGRWTGGPKNLVSMTLNDVMRLQSNMRTPENRALYGDGAGSSALGRYQIVGQTLKGLVKEMGLSGNELFDEKMQDAMASRLVARRAPEGLEGLRREWTSLNKVSNENLVTALNNSRNGPTRENAGLLGANKSFIGPPTPAPQLPTYDVKASEERLKLIENAQAAGRNYAKSLDAGSMASDLQTNAEAADKLNDKIKEIEKNTARIGEKAEGSGKEYAKLVAEIKNGDYGKKAEQKDPTNKIYKEALAKAKAFDDANAKFEANEKLRKGSTKELEQLEKDRLQINRELAEEQKKVANPDYKTQSQDLQNLTTKLDSYLEKVKALYGGDSAEYKAAVAKKNEILGGQGLLDATKVQAGIAKETQAIKIGLMSQTQARQYELQRQLAAVDANTQAIIAAGGNEVEAVEQAEAAKAAIRAKYQEESSPISKQMKEWGDLTGNLAEASTRWMDSLADGLTGLIMGTGDLKSAIQGIIKDIVNMGLKKLMSGMFGGDKGAGAASAGKGKGGAFPAAPGAAAGKGKGATAGKGKAAAVGLFHTGGIIGGAAPMIRGASPSLFKGAPKLHDGGIIGGGLLPSEVPIIAKKGEGVFTPEQMASMGGIQQNQAISIQAPITVNGSAGTPEQNDDLAKKMARQMETTMRGVVADEMRKQTRPGNFMNQRTR